MKFLVHYSIYTMSIRARTTIPTHVSLYRIDHWDLEKERVILLSDNNIISVKYNFILGQIEELKFIPVPYISKLLFGEFKYPSSYVL